MSRMTLGNSETSAAKPPFKKWRILHRAKIAKRNGDTEMLNKLAKMYEKLEEVTDAKP